MRRRGARRRGRAGPARPPAAQCGAGSGGGGRAGSRAAAAGPSAAAGGADGVGRVATAMGGPRRPRGGGAWLSPTMKCIFEYLFVRMPSLCPWITACKYYALQQKTQTERQTRETVGWRAFTRGKCIFPRSGGRCVEERGYSFLRRLSPPTQNRSLVCILCWRLMHTATVRFERHFCLCVPVCVRYWR